MRAPTQTITPGDFKAWKKQTTQNPRDSLQYTSPGSYPEPLRDELLATGEVTETEFKQKISNETQLGLLPNNCVFFSQAGTREHAFYSRIIGSRIF